MATLQPFRCLPLTVRLLLINQFGMDIGSYILIPYLAMHLGKDLGLSAAVVGAVVGVRNLSQQGLFILGGTAADRLGARRVIPAGCLLRTTGFTLFAFGGGLPIVLAASVLSGLAGALFYPAVRTYITLEAVDRKAEAFALLNVASTTGGLVGLLAGGLLLLMDFRVCALSAAAVFAVLTIAQLAALPAREVALAHGSIWNDWREVLGNRWFLAFAITMVGMFTLENQLYLLLPDGARRISGWDGAVCIPPALGTIANLVFQLRITHAVRIRGGAARWVGPGLALMGLGFVPPVLVVGLGEPADAHDAVLRILPLSVGALLLYAGVMVAQPCVIELVPKFGREDLTGTHFGMFSVFSGIAAASGNTLVGWAMDSGQHSGRAWLPWVCCLGIGLLSAAGVTWLYRHQALPVDYTTALSTPTAS
ncbi:MFS transporter [Streptantibioticus ferralitis]|uniref:MFS transporter n=1 Tax=Streptantibioticus ferralitis TaxID=236510 RepID=A0ABT5Z8Q9_9ACTN|nr:MFS transporter [Streptantibioticus ferralitis]MDF2260219.1 MFS transporter [Streptantibioticus ferralitis]